MAISVSAGVSGERKGSKALNVTVTRFAKRSGGFGTTVVGRNLRLPLGEVLRGRGWRSTEAMFRRRYVFPAPLRPITTCTFVGGMERGFTLKVICSAESLPPRCG